MKKREKYVPQAEQAVREQAQADKILQTVERTEHGLKMKKLAAGLVLDPHAPRTNFILGAALSGGDPIAAAEMVLEQSEESEE
jgi:hypothetical protein